MTVRGLVAVAFCVWSCGGDSKSVPADAEVDAAPDAAPDAKRNLPPISNAGGDTTHIIGMPFALDGSGSTDPDGDLVGYQWSVDQAPAGSTATLTNTTSAEASFAPDKLGTYAFALVVTDNDGATARDTVSVVVEPGTFTVNAGPDKTVLWGYSVPLEGSYVSQSGPGTVTWHVLSHPGPTLSGPVPIDSLTGSQPGEWVGTYVLELEVTTPAGVATDTVTVTVLPPLPQPLAGDIVDIEVGGYNGDFAIASINPPRVRVLEPRWPVSSPESVVPISVTPTAIGFSQTEDYVSVIHDSSRVTLVSTVMLMQLSTIDVGVPLLDVRHGSATPRAYPAQAGQLTLVNHFGGAPVTPGGGVPGPSRGRESRTASRPLYALVLGVSNSLRRYDGHDENTAFVSAWPYADGQYPLGADLWLVLDWIVTASGHVFNASEDAAVDMTHQTFLAGDQPFEIVSASATRYHLVTLADRITTGPQLPETQVRFYSLETLELKHVEVVPDYIVGGVPQRVVGHAVTATVVPGHVFVIGSAGTSYALFTIPEPPP